VVGCELRRRGDKKKVGDGGMEKEDQKKKWRGFRLEASGEPSMYPPTRVQQCLKGTSMQRPCCDTVEVKVTMLISFGSYLRLEDFGRHRLGVGKIAMPGLNMFSNNTESKHDQGEAAKWV